MKIKTVMIATVGVATLATTTQSCLALATSSIGLSILKQILLGGITKGLGIFADKNAFLQNNLIDQALPSELRQINSVLEKIAPSLVQKEREYIAEAAAYTVNIAEPILVNAVNSLTAEDVQRVANGGKGAATMLLKEKTAEQLMLAIQPKVDQKLNEFGIVSSINMALQGNQILGSILGSNSAMSATSPLSRLASEQLVNGLFKLVEQHEQQNSIQLLDAIQKQ
ncbi:DUF4197 family protein [Planobacterium oryzisoli]|uniref:DUF4197 family protein n=1 Tax=Planobacterium oryzisoli TaxID=2771435 RepID=A0A930YTR2_9FLAO|nr:DUF4197 family protein [Planobacterium oryzisoli]MBF5026208.1 DUF4197 family protein [Planobacterium oryzisoli]